MKVLFLGVSSLNRTAMTSCRWLATTLFSSFPLFYPPWEPMASAHTSPSWQVALLSGGCLLILLISSDQQPAWSNLFWGRKKTHKYEWTTVSKMVGAQVLYVCSSQKLKEFSFGPRGTNRIWHRLWSSLTTWDVFSLMPLVHLLLPLDKYLLRFH